MLFFRDGEIHLDTVITSYYFKFYCYAGADKLVSYSIMAVNLKDDNDDVCYINYNNNAMLVVLIIKEQMNYNDNINYSKKSKIQSFIQRNIL